MTAGAAFKILTAQQWSDWKDACVLHGAPIDLQDGFIHLSAADQVHETAAKHFAGQTGLILAEIDLAQLGSAVRWETSRGGALFPHVYAPIPLSALVSSVAMDDSDFSPAAA